MGTPLQYRQPEIDSPEEELLPRSLAELKNGVQGDGPANQIIAKLAAAIAAQNLVLANPGSAKVNVTSYPGLYLLALCAASASLWMAAYWVIRSII